MSQFLATTSTDTDQDSPLTGRDPNVPGRDSVMEILRERDCYLYERIKRTQGTAANGFYGSLTSDLIDPDGVATYTIPADEDRPNNGLLLSQCDHVRVDFNTGYGYTSGPVIWVWEVEFPGDFDSSEWLPVVSWDAATEPAGGTTTIYYEHRLEVAAGVRTGKVWFHLQTVTPPSFPFDVFCWGSVTWIKGT